MKAKEIKEIRGLSIEKLEAKLQELKKDLFMLRMQHATNQLDNPDCPAVWIGQLCSCECEQYDLLH